MIFLVEKVFLEKQGEYGDKKIFLGLNPISSEELGYVVAKSEAAAAQKLSLKKLILKRQFSGYYLPKSDYKKSIEILSEPERYHGKLPTIFAYDISKLIKLTKPLS